MLSKNTPSYCTSWERTFPAHCKWQYLLGMTHKNGPITHSKQTTSITHYYCVKGNTENANYNILVPFGQLSINSYVHKYRSDVQYVLILYRNYCTTCSLLVVNGTVKRAAQKHETLSHRHTCYFNILMYYLGVNNSTSLVISNFLFTSSTVYLIRLLSKTHFKMEGSQFSRLYINHVSSADRFPELNSFHHLAFTAILIVTSSLCYGTDLR